MKRTISVGYGRTVNTGNFENFKLDMGLTTEIENTDCLEEKANKEFYRLKNIVEDVIISELGGK